MANKINLNGQTLKAALEEIVEVGLHIRKKLLNETLTKKCELVHVGSYSIALMPHLLFLMMCRYRRRR